MSTHPKLNCPRTDDHDAHVWEAEQMPGGRIPRYWCDPADPYADTRLADRARREAENRDPMPEFTIKAKDLLALDTLLAYAELCREHGLDWQAGEVDSAIQEMRDWQRRNWGQMKLPDHRHVPVAERMAER